MISNSRFCQIINWYASACLTPGQWRRRRPFLSLRRKGIAFLMTCDSQAGVGRNRSSHDQSLKLLLEDTCTSTRGGYASAISSRDPWGVVHADTSGTVQLLSHPFGELGTSRHWSGPLEGDTGSEPAAAGRGLVSRRRRGLIEVQALTSRIHPYCLPHRFSHICTRPVA